MALDNARSHGRLQKVAAIDSLSGLLNRWFDLENSGEGFSQAHCSKETMGVLLFDIDARSSRGRVHCGHRRATRVVGAGECRRRAGKPELKQEQPALHGCQYVPCRDLRSEDSGR